jgi:DNA-binding transcriptional LysR family regulator
MRALERSAGAVLAVRAGRGMRLTAAGDALARHAGSILAGIAAAEEDVAAIAGLRAGRVRLAAFPSGSATLVPAAIADVMRRHPGLQVTLHEAEPPESLALLRAGECDLVLAFRYPADEQARDEHAGPRHGAGERSDPDDAGLDVMTLFDDALSLVLPAGHRQGG